MADTARAQQEIHLDVDLMILDYFLCSCIRAVLRDRDAKRRDGIYTENTQRQLITFTDFQRLYRVNHPEHTPSNDLEIKLQILNFANLFLCRQIESPWSPSSEGVKDRRAKDAARASQWLQQNNHHASPLFDPWHGAGAPELTQEMLANNRQRMLSELRLSREDSLRDLENSTSLLDLLPEFVSLASTLTTYCKEETQMWGEYVSEFMLQASLEQYYIYGNTQPSMADEAFAWNRIVLQPSSSEKGVTILGEEQKARYKQHLHPDKRISWNWHLREVGKRFPLLRFEDAILDLLELLLNFLQKPILTQLEEGKLENLSETETSEFKKRVGFV